MLKISLEIAGVLASRTKPRMLIVYHMGVKLKYAQLKLSNSLLKNHFELLKMRPILLTRPLLMYSTCVDRQLHTLHKFLRPCFMNNYLSHFSRIS